MEALVAPAIFGVSSGLAIRLLPFLLSLTTCRLGIHHWRIYTREPSVYRAWGTDRCAFCSKTCFNDSGQRR